MHAWYSNTNTWIEGLHWRHPYLCHTSERELQHGTIMSSRLEQQTEVTSPRMPLGHVMLRGVELLAVLLENAFEAIKGRAYCREVMQGSAITHPSILMRVNETSKIGASNFSTSCPGHGRGLCFRTSKEGSNTWKKGQVGKRVETSGIRTDLSGASTSAARQIQPSGQPRAMLLADPAFFATLPVSSLSPVPRSRACPLLRLC